MRFGEARPTRAGTWWPLAVLWCAGAAVRLPLLAVPPLLPAIHADLDLSETAVGALTGIPVALAATAALLGSWLVARAGARRTLTLGLALAAGTGAARGLGGIPALYVLTGVMGLGLAVALPALPALTGLWCPDRVGRATAIYVNGELIGEIAPVALTAALVAGLLGGWRPALALWSLPVGLTAAIIWLGAPREQLDPGARARLWWPDWRSGHVWRLGLILGCASITYQGANTFIPEYLRTVGHTALVAPVLTTLNLAQLPASLLIATFPRRTIGRRLPFAGSGLLCMLAVAGLLLTGAQSAPLWAGLLGFGAGAAFILSLALPQLLSAAHDVHRLSAAMLTISAAAGLLGPLLGGALWDLTGTSTAAFLVVVGANALMVALASGTVPSSQHH